MKKERSIAQIMTILRFQILIDNSYSDKLMLDILNHRLPVILDMR
jgi:hypothetical protein